MWDFVVFLFDKFEQWLDHNHMMIVFFLGVLIALRIAL